MCSIFNEEGKLTKAEIVQKFKDKGISGKKMVQFDDTESLEFNYCETLMDFVNNNDDFVVYEYSKDFVSILLNRDEEAKFYPLEELISEAEIYLKRLKSIK